MLRYTSCGLQNIWLKNGYTVIETDYGNATSIHNIEGLHAAIGLHIINNKPRLSGAEVRFFRKELDLSQIHLSQLLGVSDVSVRGWENHRTKITKPADKILRILFAEQANGNKKIKEFFECLSHLNREEYNKNLELEETDSGWKQAA